MEKVVAGVFRMYREESGCIKRGQTRESHSSIEHKSNDNMTGEELTSEHIDFISNSNKKNPASLSKVCNLFLGKELDKTEQVSTWNIRPLSTSQVSVTIYVILHLWNFIIMTLYICIWNVTQILYACIDAHVLLAVLSNILDAPPEDLDFVKALYPFCSSHATLAMSSLSLAQVVAMGSSREKSISKHSKNPTSSNIQTDSSASKTAEKDENAVVDLVENADHMKSSLREGRVRRQKYTKNKKLANVGSHSDDN